MSDNGDRHGLVISYLMLRRLIGLLGVLLPVLLAIGCLTIGKCTGLLTSISAYYDTAMRDVFVGILFTIAWFLYAYKGYGSSDDRAGHVACAFALGIALFPTTSTNGVVQTLHLLFAVGFFLTLAYFSLVLFTKTRPGVEPTPGKKRRNKVYRTAGIVMLACIGLIAVYYLFLENTPIAGLKPVFWLETLALWAFGWSWIIKGEWLLGDDQPPEPA